MDHPSDLSSQRKTRRRAVAALTLTGILVLLTTAIAQAKVTTFGSPLSVPATLDTAYDLSYPGTNTNVPASPEAPTGVVHTYHYGADAVLWNLAQANGAPRAPATGQALKVSLEGCAVRAADGTPPLTQIHFQDITPQPNGGAKINITSQAFEIPVCGNGGVSGSTVTTYEPINLCVSAGDAVGFNEEGGFVGHSYQSGVPYRVLGRVAGSSAASFIRGGGTNNGTVISPADTSAMDGFAQNLGEELLMRVTLGTGADATHICAGGTKGLPPALAPIRVSPQTDGVNHSRIVSVAMFCRVSPCNGVATLSSSGAATSGYGGVEVYGRAGFTLQPSKTVHLPIRVTSKLVRKIRAKHGMSVTVTAVVNGKTVTQQITIKIL
jgi:hypothetical protein